MKKRELKEGRKYKKEGRKKEERKREPMVYSIISGRALALHA
jgi:hypothetical protein